MLLFRNKNKEVISEFLKTAYSDTRLRETLQLAKSGGMNWQLACLVNLADNVKHGLGEGLVSPVTSPPAKAFLNLAGYSPWSSNSGRDQVRNHKMVPLLEAEISRRQKVKQQEEAARLAEGKALTEELIKSMTGKETYGASKPNITESVR